MEEGGGGVADQVSELGEDVFAARTAECGRNAEGGGRMSAERGGSTAECGVRPADVCGVRSADRAECGLQTGIRGARTAEYCGLMRTTEYCHLIRQAVLLGRQRWEWLRFQSAPAIHRDGVRNVERSKG